MKDDFLLFSFRRFLEACGTRWEPISDISARAHLSDPTASRQVAVLRDEGYIDVWADGARLTDAGIFKAAQQSPSYTDLYDKSAVG